MSKWDPEAHPSEYDDWDGEGDLFNDDRGLTDDAPGMSTDDIGAEYNAWVAERRKRRRASG